MFYILLICQYAYSQDNCHIVYCAHPSAKPYEWIDEKGELVGINIDLLKILTKQAGCTYEIVSSTWAEGMLDGFKDKSITMISTMRLINELSPRDAYMMQLQPVDIVYRYFLTRTDGPDIQTMEDLNNKTVLVALHGISDDVSTSLQEQYNLNIKRYSRIKDAIRSLSEGEGDVCFFSMNQVNEILANENYSNLKLSSDPIMLTTMGFMLHKDNIELYTKLDKALTELKINGSYYKLMDKWSGNPEKYRYTLKIVFGALLAAFAILIWNSMLQYRVRKKTKELNEEINTRIAAENNLRETNEENARLRDEAYTTSRMAALGQMAASVAHEINNPTSLINYNMEYLSLFLDKLIVAGDAYFAPGDTVGVLKWEDAKKEALRSKMVINESINIITSTVNDLKEYGRINKINYEKLDLNECLRLSVKLTAFFTKNYTNSLSVHTLPHPAVIYGNSMHIGECLINLIQNACCALRDKSGKIDCKVSLDGGYAVVSVSDDGIGMDEETLGKVCDMFFTTRPESGGTGLGLPITSRIVKDHDGLMKIDSIQGSGTTVSLYFPLHKTGGSA